MNLFTSQETMVKVSSLLIMKSQMIRQQLYAFSAVFLLKMSLS